MFLTPDDLYSLTGYKKPKLQRQWLIDNGYHFDVRIDGRPVVTVAQVQARQLKGLPSKSTALEEPDFEALGS